jgi:tetratricopeptide (TPR) repeat protein
MIVPARRQDSRGGDSPTRAQQIDDDRVAELDAFNRFIDEHNEAAKEARSRLPEVPLEDLLGEIVSAPWKEMNRFISALIDAAAGPAPSTNHDPLALLVAAESLANQLRDPSVRSIALMRLYVARARVSQERGDLANAVAALDRAASYIPDTFQGDVWLGEIHLHQAKIQAAAGQYDSALRLLLEAYRKCGEDIAGEIRQCFSDTVQVMRYKSGG